MVCDFFCRGPKTCTNSKVTQVGSDSYYANYPRNIFLPHHCHQWITSLTWLKIFSRSPPHLQVNDDKFLMHSKQYGCMSN